MSATKLGNTTTTTTTTVVASVASPTIRTSDCRKFSPNIFNKSKCSHCFRQREEHSASALECNRASRKVSKCGYLFVAPDWDFSNPLYRTKRWQRRWFVLYDDGELTYSVDDHPETIPQACIDMTKVLEVAPAEDVTGHAYAIAITAPDRVTFVKGTCSEESKWWLNILAAFPKSKGRHKRNATFPGGQATTKLQTTTSANTDSITPMITRNRHNSYTKEALMSAQSTGVLNLSCGVGGKNYEPQNSAPIKTMTRSLVADHGVVVVDDDEEDDGVETGEEADEDDDDDVNEANMELTQMDSLGNKSSTGVVDDIGNDGYDENNRNAGNEISSKVTSCKLIKDLRRDKKIIKDLTNTITNLAQHEKQRWATTANVNNVLNSQQHHPHHLNHNHLKQQQQHLYQHVQREAVVSNKDKNSRDETDFQHRNSKMQQQQQIISNQSRPKSLPLASSTAPAIVSAIVKKIPPVLATTTTSSSSANLQQTDTNNNNNSNKIINHNNQHNSNNNKNNSKSSPRLQMQLKYLQQKQSQQQQQQQSNSQQQYHRQHLISQNQQQQTNERGDPDGGCNLDDLSSNYLSKTSELRVNLPAPTMVSTNTTAAVEGTISIVPPPPPSNSTASTIKATATSTPNATTKKGWLMKQDNRTGDFTKHWFTLNGAALFYYRDAISEERGVLDGVLDVNSITQVTMDDATNTNNKGYAFTLTTWDKRRLTLASLSPNSRNSWMAALRNAAGIQTPGANNQTTNSCSLETTTNCNTEVINNNNNNNNNKEQLHLGKEANQELQEIEKDFIKAQRNHETNNQVITCDASPIPPALVNLQPNRNKTVSETNELTVLSPLTPPTPKILHTHFSSDEEYRTASEGGRRDSIDWGSPLSPSPPTLGLLRIKDRVRARSTNCPRLHKRSRSSPPTSRRSTMDSVGSDDLPTPPIITTVQEELNIDKELHFRLRVAEKECDLLRGEAKQQESRIAELLGTLERTEHELTSRIQEMENVRDNLSAELDEAKRNTESIITDFTEELTESQQKIKELEDRLLRGIDENENLYKRLRELESCSPSSLSNLKSSKFKRMDSLSDLTQINEIDPYCLERDALADEYNEVRSRFEKAVNEIRAMKRELKESQNQYDSLEISYASLKQDLGRKDLEDRAQLQMMAARIQDLTLKYSSSERQVRSLKQKLAKSERRRSLSLKGSAKEPLSLSKEFELKVCELEGKIDELEQQSKKPPTRTSPSSKTTTTSIPSTSSHSNVKIRSKKSSRRRSLESSASAESLQLMVRVNDLEKRVDGANTPTTSSTAEHSNSSSSISEASTVRHSKLKLSEHLIERLRCLEGVLITSKDRLEQGLQQLQNLRGSRTRRSMSPITTDRKDSYRFIERCLVEVLKLLRESCETCLISGSRNSSSTNNNNATDLILLPESSPVKLALTQLETQLRNKLSELLKQRRLLRESNGLTKVKELELLAGRIAFESIIFSKLRDSCNRAETSTAKEYSKSQLGAEVAETTHLMRMLKAKLSGKSALKSNGSTDVLAGVLARRLLLSSQCAVSKDIKATRSLAIMDANMLDQLLQQQNELNVIMKRYKMNALENLATGLAAETLSYISGNDMVQGAVQEAWRHAQETVNVELVQTEIMQVMMRHAERLENAIKPALGFTLTAEQCVTFEKFADAVHDALRKEMELAAAQITHCYEAAIERMKSGQWHMFHAEQERKASEARLLLTEFADIIGHKALIDARINVLRGQEMTTSAVATEPVQSNQVQSLMKYEQLFDELSNELQVNNPADLVAEADFEFICKQKTLELFGGGENRQVFDEISSFLAQLEDSLIALQCESGAMCSVSRSKMSIETLQDVCQKCCDLRQRADELLQEVHRKVNSPCQYCQQMREQCESRQQQHESEFMQVKQQQAQELNVLLQQVEQQRQALQSLESEKLAIQSDMNKSQELIRQRESDLLEIKQQLKSKESELQRQQQERREMLARQQSREQRLQEDTDVLNMKCAQQTENYSALLQERDGLKSELLKEKERRQLFEKRLEMLELEHTKQLECLQEAYRDQLLSHCSDFPSNVSDEESFRQRYQLEIEQLRTLCEKGLSAMDSSHRRIISDLKETHRQEIERLLLEKETALAEETQATLAALDAMRKAHQSEVQREVARFKQEFFKQIQRGEQFTLDSAKAKEEELEELRKEIFSFSEKYSIKCVENAALEEKLQMVTQKLKHLQQMQQFELRNKQFRAHLASEDPATDANFVQGLTTGHMGDITCQDSERDNVSGGNQEPVILNSKQILRYPDNYQDTEVRRKIGKTSMHDIDRHDEDLTLNITKRWSYEPCYNLRLNPFYFSSEGLKSSTFGKDLRTVAVKKPPAKSLTSTSSSTDINNRTSSPASSSFCNNNNETLTIYANELNINENKNNNNQQLFKEEVEHNQLMMIKHNSKLAKTTTLITTTKPVEQPKNISANKNNTNTNPINYIIDETQTNNNIEDEEESTIITLQGQNLKNSHSQFVTFNPITAAAAATARPSSSTTTTTRRNKTTKEVNTRMENNSVAAMTTRQPIELSIVEDADADNRSR